MMTTFIPFDEMKNIWKVVIPKEVHEETVTEKSPLEKADNLPNEDYSPRKPLTPFHRRLMEMD